MTQITASVEEDVLSVKSVLGGDGGIAASLDFVGHAGTISRAAKLMKPVGAPTPRFFLHSTPSPNMQKPIAPVNAVLASLPYVLCREVASVFTTQGMGWRGGGILSVITNPRRSYASTFHCPSHPSHRTIKLQKVQPRLSVHT